VDVTTLGETWNFNPSPTFPLQELAHNIKTDLTKIWCKTVNQNHMAQDRDQGGFCNKKMNLLSPSKGENFLTNYATISVKKESVP
jgi:hypothetical protein